MASVYKKEIGSGGQRVHLAPSDSTLSSELQNFFAYKKLKDKIRIIYFYLQD